jgi:hypothetical protein
VSIQIASEVAISQCISAITKGEIATIAIGPQKKLYHVHKALICHHSDYFRTVYNGRWKEAEDGVALEDVHVGVFNLFVHWLYTQRLPRDDSELVRVTEVVCSSVVAASNMLLEACVFGDRFLAPAFQCIAHNIFIESNKDSPGILYEHVILAYNEFPEDSPMLRFMVHMQCTRWHPDGDVGEEKELQSQLPQRFLLSVMLEYDKLRRAARWPGSLEGSCTYHLHMSEEEMKECRAKINKEDK